MEIIWKAWDVVQKQIRTSAGSSSGSAPDYNLFEAARKISDHVHEVCKTANPSVEIVLFHGLQLEDSNAKDSHLHINTWVSRGNQPELWLKWLLRENHFPHARILVISYDASMKRGDDGGQMDTYVTSENLIQDLTMKPVQVGEYGCPVVLVGHCLGGLVMKELCVAADTMLSQDRTESVENFLRNVKGFFTYASPHNGLRLADSNTEFPRGHLFQDLTTLNHDAARRNFHFGKLRNKYKWMSSGVGESVAVTLDLGSSKFKGILVEEASARENMDEFYTIAENHFNVCRPHSTTSTSFQLLSNFISTVVEKHSRPILSTNNGLLVNPKMVGLEAGVKNVLEKLSDTRPRLGIVGLGGIGKTTLAKAVYEKISGEFHYACFLEEIKTKMTEEDTRDVLRMKIKEKLKHKGQDVSESFNWSKLKGKKVIIILDDAEFESHVSVMTAEDDFSKESRVIVTSRTRDFLRQQNFVIHDAEGLDLHDSQRLFCQHVFDRPKVPANYKDYEGLVTDFAKKCDGLPLALKVAGSHLKKYKQNKTLWHEAFKKLSQAKAVNGKSEDGLWSLLGVIIDALAPVEQEMFMDVATCFRGTNLAMAQKAWKACTWTGGTAEIGWQNLLDRCLVSKNVAGLIGMHELLRDLGRSRAGNSRVVDIQQLRRLREEEKAIVKVLTLVTSEVDDVRIQAYMLSGLKELQILWFRNVRLPSEPITWDFQSLRALSFRFCFDAAFFSGGKLHSDAAFFSKRKLQSLKRLTMKKAPYPFKRLLESAGQLTHLEIDNCRDLTALPCIAQPSALQHLEIRKCDSLKVVPWIAQLTTLQHLEIEHCPELEALPCIAPLTALEHLKIYKCNRLKVVPLIALLTRLQHLEIKACNNLEALPSTIGQLPALEHLEIEGRESLGELSKSNGQLTALQHMEIEECRSLKAFPSSLGKLTALEHMIIRYCESLKALPSTIGDLCALKHLEITHCWTLTELPEAVGQLQALRSLNLRGLHLKTLPGSLGKLHKLENLKISCMFRLQKFPDIFGQLMALRELYLADCYQLVAPPNLSRQLDALQKLTIDNCPSITETPDWARQLGVKVFFREAYRLTNLSFLDYQKKCDSWDPKLRITS